MRHRSPQHKVSVKDLFRQLWAQVTLALLGGWALISVADNAGPFETIVEHIGLALIVAAFVTASWHLRELSEFFTSLAKSVLIQHEYLRTLDLISLRQLRSSAAAAVLERVVDNPNYRWQDLESWVDAELFEKLLPGKGLASGIYRQDLSDIITLAFMSLGEALTELGEETAGASAEDLDKEIVKQTTVTRYKVLAPRQNDAAYKQHTVTLSGDISDMPHFPDKRRIHFRVGTSPETAVEVPIEFTNPPRGGIEYKGTHSVDLVNGQIDVWTEIVEYMPPRREPFVLSTMSDLTHGLHVTLNAKTNKKVLLEGDIMGLGGSDKRVKDYSPNGITLRYPGWLFEDHGYIIWWWGEED